MDDVSAFASSSPSISMSSVNIKQKIRLNLKTIIRVVPSQSQSPSQATRAHMAALISVSVALSQTPAEAASPRTLD